MREIPPAAPVAVPIYGSRTYNFQVKTTRNVSAGTYNFFFPQHIHGRVLQHQCVKQRLQRQQCGDDR